MDTIGSYGSVYGSMNWGGIRRQNFETPQPQQIQVRKQTLLKFNENPFTTFWLMLRTFIDEQ